MSLEWCDCANGRGGFEVIVDGFVLSQDGIEVDTKCEARVPSRLTYIGIFLRY